MREGLVPTVLGTAVAASGFALSRKYPSVGIGLAGFGLAHIVLGAIDLAQHRQKPDEIG